MKQHSKGFSRIAVAVTVCLLLVWPPSYTLQFSKFKGNLFIGGNSGVACRKTFFITVLSWLAILSTDRSSAQQEHFISLSLPRVVFIVFNTRNNRKCVQIETKRKLVSIIMLSTFNSVLVIST